MINILFIHQSAEMYGSDKTILLLLKNLDKNKFFPVIILPDYGPLKTALELENIQVVIAPVLKLYRKMFTPKNIFIFIRDYKNAIFVLENLHKKYNFDFIYSNTLATLIGIIFARKKKLKHLWHVHEIIVKPVVFYKGFCKLLGLKSNTKIVYNSIATSSFWNVNDSILCKSKVIYNASGLEKIDLNTKKIDFGFNENDIVVTLVGRISRLKGHKWLLNTYLNRLQSYKNIKILFVGSPVEGQEYYLHKIEKLIVDNKLNDVVKILPFYDYLSTIWAITDIAIMPSTEAESFGLVALEAMLAKKPVIGSNHGGLVEIIVDNETGFLVEPNNENALAKALSKLIENENLRRKFGENGYQRATSKFSVEKYISKFEQLFLEMVN